MSAWTKIDGLKGPQGDPGSTGATGPSGTTDFNALSNKPALGTAAARDVPASGDASGSQVVLGSDSRLEAVDNVSSVIAGTGVTISPTSGIGDVTINAVPPPVTKLIAGTGVTVSPVGGLGDVTINATPPPVTSLIAGSGVTISPVGGLGDVTINGVAPTWASITSKPSTFPPALPILESDVTGLVTDLAGKAATVHTHVKANITDFPTLGTAAPLNVPASGNATSGQVVLGSDGRLTDARPLLGSIAESAVTNLTTDLAAKTPTTRTLTAGDGLTGGGDLSANRTLAVDGTVVRTTQLDGYSVALGAYSSNVLSAPRPIYNVIEIFDEFTSYNTGYSVSGVMPVPPNNWYAQVVSSSTIIYVSNGADVNNKAVGCWGIETNPVASAYARIYLPTAYIVLGCGQLDLFFRIAFYAIPGSTGAAFRVGLTDSPGTYTNSVHLLISYQSGNASWAGYNLKAGAGTLGSLATTPTITAFSASSLTFYKCQISVNPAASSVSYYVNGLLIDTVTTNIPTVAITPFLAVENQSGAIANTLFVDKFYLRYLVAQ